MPSSSTKRLHVGVLTFHLNITLDEYDMERLRAIGKRKGRKHGIIAAEVIKAYIDLQTAMAQYGDTPDQFHQYPIQTLREREKAMIAMGLTETEIEREFRHNKLLEHVARKETEEAQV